jgi:hypothetical protein
MNCGIWFRRVAVLQERGEKVTANKGFNYFSRVYLKKNWRDKRTTSVVSALISNIRPVRNRRKERVGTSTESCENLIVK